MFFRSISEKQDARYGVGIILKCLTNGLDHQKKRVGIRFSQYQTFSYALPAMAYQGLALASYSLAWTSIHLFPSLWHLSMPRGLNHCLKAQITDLTHKSQTCGSNSNQTIGHWLLRGRCPSHYHHYPPQSTTKGQRERLSI